MARFVTTFVDKGGRTHCSNYFALDPPVRRVFCFDAIPCVHGIAFLFPTIEGGRKKDVMKKRNRRLMQKLFLCLCYILNRDPSWLQEMHRITN